MSLTIHYTGFSQLPDEETLDKVAKLHMQIFGLSNDELPKIKGRNKLRVDLALDDDKVVSYKIGYSMTSNQFYSFLGGVDP